MSQKNISSRGFTLIEIALVILLIGILSAVVAGKYFDLRAQAEEKAVMATVAEVQSRINARFAELLLNNHSCQSARNLAVNLNDIADEATSNGARFGDYFFTGHANEYVNPTILVQISDLSTAITQATLYAPSCGDENSGGDSGDSGDSGDGGDGGDTGGDSGETNPDDWKMSTAELLEKYGYSTIVFGNGYFDLPTWIDAAKTPGKIYAGSDNKYYVKIDDLPLSRPHELNVDDENNWVRFSETGWDKTPEKGSYYMDENKNVYIYNGSGGTNPSKPSSGVDAEGWIPLIVTPMP